MRTIPDDVLDLIAGGRKVSTWNSWTTSITIIGHAEPDPQPWYPGDFGGSWSGGGGQSGPVAGSHHSTPVPQFAPANVDMDTMRNVVLDAANQIKALADRDGNEHGCMIVRTGDGTLKAGPIEAGTDDAITFGYTPLPGESIVAWVHSHPYTVGINERLPSSTDVASYRAILNQPGVDANALMYIVDMESGGSYEYQKGLHPDRQGPDISRDM